MLSALSLPSFSLCHLQNPCYLWLQSEKQIHLMLTRTDTSLSPHPSVSALHLFLGVFLLCFPWICISLSLKYTRVPLLSTFPLKFFHWFCAAFVLFSGRQGSDILAKRHCLKWLHPAECLGSSPSSVLTSHLRLWWARWLRLSHQREGRMNWERGRTFSFPSSPVSHSCLVLESIACGWLKRTFDSIFLSLYDLG